MTQSYSITLTATEQRLLADVTAYHAQTDYPTTAYLQTPYGMVPAETWKAYRAATAD